MSVETLLFFVLLLQVALIVIIYRKERHVLDAIYRAQNQNGKWMNDLMTRLRDDMRGEACARGRLDDGVPDEDLHRREFSRSWEERSED